MISLRGRIMFGTVGATALVVVLASVAAWWSVSTMLHSEQDRRLADRLDRMTVHHPGDPVTGMQPWRLPQREYGPGGLSLLQVLDRATGKVLISAQSVPEGTDLSGLTGSPTLITLPDGRSFSGSRVHLEPGPEMDRLIAALEGTRSSIQQPVDVCLAQDMGPIHNELVRLGWILFGVCVGATVLAILVGLWLRSVVLKPLTDLSEAIAGLGPERLEARLGSLAVPLEVRPVVERLDDLLIRLDSAFARERSTIANLAHELRSPIAALRSSLEFGLMDEPSSYGQVLQECLPVVVRMQDMAANLLLLARIEAGQEPVPLTQVAVATVVQSSWDQVTAHAVDRHQEADLGLDYGLILVASVSHLHLLCANLLDNAVHHAPVGSRITVRLHSAASGAVLEVANPATTAVDPAVVFRPFYRGSRERTNDGHCGLGLALCQRLTHLLAGAITVESTVDHFTVRVVLPNRDILLDNLPVT